MSAVNGPRVRLAVVVVAAAAFGGIAAKVLWIGGGPKMTIVVKGVSVGSVAEWVSGVGTVAAVFAAIVVYIKDQRDTQIILQNGLDQLEVAQRGLELQVSAQERIQASGVTAWLDWQMAGAPDDPLWRPEDARAAEDFAAAVDAITRDFSSGTASAVGTPRQSVHRQDDLSGLAWLVVVCQNVSGQPVFDVEVTVELDGHPTGTRPARLDTLEWPAWPPEASVIRERALANETAIVIGVDSVRLTVRRSALELRFTDAAGRRWRRTLAGGLERHSAD